MELPLIAVRGQVLDANGVCVADCTAEDLENFKAQERAKLMAASPYLLAALKNFVDGCSVSVDAFAVARAAIEKAEI